MYTKNKSLLIRTALTLAATIFITPRITAQEISFHNEASDTTRITSILIDESTAPPENRVSRIARIFLDTPYRSATLEGDSIETLRINLDSMDCTTFVETVLALAMTANEHRQSWHDFAYNLRQLRYRNGETDGYPSRLHYISDWILDNSARGNLKEITAALPGARHNIKTLDYMSSHRDAYPALADSINYTRIRNIEAGFSNHRYPCLKSSAVKDKTIATTLADGDIICFTTSIKGLDATHIAILSITDNTPHIIHASSKAGKVVVDRLTLAEYLRRNRTEGIRVIRLVND